MKMRYRAGDALFREGDPSDFACQILEGSFEVRRNAGGDSVVLGELGPGDLTGEMGVLENLPRSATVVARTDACVEAIPAEAFADWIAARPEAARRLLTRQSAKVRSLTEEVARLYAALRRFDPQAEGPSLVGEGPTQTSARPGAAAAPALIAKPPPAARRIALRCLGAAGDAQIVVGRLPFRVGRRAPEIGQIDNDAQTLLVEDAFPFRVSLNHFALIDDPKLGLAVRDLGSDLGTCVNGQFLGGIFAKDTCRLMIGSNAVVAGGLDSPFVFKIAVEEE